MVANHFRSRAPTAAGLVTRRYPVRDLIRAKIGASTDDLPLLVSLMIGAQASLDEKRNELVITAVPDALPRAEQLLDDLRSNRGQQIGLSIRVLSAAGTPTKGSPDDPNAALFDLFRQSAALKRGERIYKLMNTADAMKLSSIGRRPQPFPMLSTITAPRLTLFDGQRAYVIVATSTAYVSGFGARRMPDGSIDPEPQISTVQYGVTVRGQPILNSDRSAVRILLHPEISSLVKMQSNQIPNPWGAEKLLIQVPMIRSFDVDDRVLIPLGQTLVIAGRKELFQVENGVRKPIDDPSQPPEPTLMLITPTLVTPGAFQQPTTRNAPPATRD